MRIDAPVKQRLLRIGRNEDMATSGRLIIEDRIFRFNGFPDVQIDLLSDWTANPLRNRSWQWNAASFNFFPNLIAYHQKSGDDRALELAVSAVDSWCRAAPKFPPDYEFARHDHATALRAENGLLLMAYLVLRNRKDALPIIRRLVLREAAKLESDAFYSAHTNHGIEQARILALVAHTIPRANRSEQRWEIAMKRLKAELKFAFTEEGVHVENSPGYHLFVCNAFMKVLASFPADRIVPLRREIDRIMPSAMRFLTHILRPDGLLPVIGDTQAVRAFNCFAPYASKDAYQWLEYSLSSGRRGQAPTRSAIAFPKSGYLVIRDRWRRSRNIMDTFHLIMKCGRHSSYHRHDDDMSLVFFCREDWLVDGGAYSYVESNPVRRYLRSKWAHNVPVVDSVEDRWAFDPKKGHAASLEVLRPMTDVVHARARTESYSGFIASREIEVARKRRLFEVNDLVESVGPCKLPTTFRSLWHVPADKSIHIQGDDVLVVSGTGALAMRITNLGEPFDCVELLDPGIEGQRGAVVSQTANLLQGCHLLSFSRCGSGFSSALRFEILESIELSGWSLLRSGKQPGLTNSHRKTDPTSTDHIGRRHR